MNRRGTRAALTMVVASAGLLLALCTPVGVGLLVALNLDDAPDGVHWLAIFGAATLGLAPVLAGTVVASWNVDPRTARGRTWFVRFVLGVAVVEVASAAAVVVVAAAGALPVWVAALAILSSVLFAGLGIWLGETIRRRIAQTEPEELTQGDLAPASLRRKWRRILLSFIVALAVSLVGVLLLDDLSGDSTLLGVVALAVAIAAIVSSGVCLGIYLPLVRRVPPLFSNDVERQKKIVGVVWKGQSIELDPAETEVAIRYAGMVVSFLPFQAAQSVLLFIGLSALRVASLASGNTGFLGFDVIFLGAIAIVLLASVPFWVIRFRRVRGYLDDRSALER
ncbi:hypothetical protein [Mycetocola zhujimingii]|uniref:hypothetical protein n=1 Tax=Mycetocola zhujimingii TaxID=2079792 RepID=UPI000D37D1ED|nr:hypothetical protein [Mycetocola zhujimingii]AWB85212.1 hypothetical protein C3E77_00150 [Mycetocola zhujimingii]